MFATSAVEHVLTPRKNEACAKWLEPKWLGMMMGIDHLPCLQELRSVEDKPFYCQPFYCPVLLTGGIVDGALANVHAGILVSSTWLISMLRTSTGHALHTKRKSLAL